MKQNFDNHDLLLFQMEEIEQKLRKGDMNDAIIFCQEIKGSSFEDSKQIIDNWILPENEAFLEEQIQARAYKYFTAKGTIYAITFIKDLKKLGLKEAIDYVNDLVMKMKSQ